MTDKIQSLTAPRLHERPQPEEMRRLGNEPVKEHRSKFNKAHKELQGFGEVGVMKGGISKGFMCLFFNLFCKHKELFHSRINCFLCHVILIR